MRVRLISLAIAAGLAAGALADSILVLRASFVEGYRRRVTISTSFHVDRPHERPNRIADDADLHIAGRGSDEIGLPCVAEIMNAAGFPDALEEIRRAHQEQTPVEMAGIWRIWFEHPDAQNPMVQGDPVPVPATTNPKHVFEIHPVLRIADLDLSDSLRPISDGETEYGYHSAKTAIGVYRKKKFVIEPDGDRVRIVSVSAPYNYIACEIERFDDSEYIVTDGAVLFARVYDEPTGELVDGKARIVLAAGTVPFETVRALQGEQRLRIVVMPRVSLSLIDYRLDRPWMWSGKLPYELVAVAVHGPPANPAR